MGKLKDSVTNWSTEDSQDRQAVKIYTTGDNDSIEDAIIAVMNIKTVDGKLLDADTQIESFLKALKATFEVLGEENE